MIDFQADPHRYKHWDLTFNARVATLTMNVDPTATLVAGYELKLNTYDMGVDIELADAVQRLRFEHPEIHCVILNSASDKVFCAGANIYMLGTSSHAHKVNFCKFTNETRNAIEDASLYSKQRYLCAIKGTAAGGGYELALACDYLMMADDGNSAVSLPEVPLLAVLPGTGGLTRIVDKRRVRRDRADVFCTLEEGIRGNRAVEWRLVDEVVPGSRFLEETQNRAIEFSTLSDRPQQSAGITLSPLKKEIHDNEIVYPHLKVDIDRDRRVATFNLLAPEQLRNDDLNVDAALAKGDRFWPLALCRELDDAILHMRSNEIELGTWVFKSQGSVNAVQHYDDFLWQNQSDWFVREVVLYWRRTLKRLDLSARTTFAFIEPGSCFVGVLAEILFSVDRSYMLEGQFDKNELEPPVVALTKANFGLYEMSNGISRLHTRFLGEPETVDQCGEVLARKLDAGACEKLGLITYVLDSIDWDDELRILLEERASFSPDCLTAMEANLRFAGPETMETKIFGRLTAWQNWVFQRPNAAGENGALRLYGTGVRPQFDKTRV